MDPFFGCADKASSFDIPSGFAFASGSGFIKLSVPDAELPFSLDFSQTSENSYNPQTIRTGFSFGPDTSGFGTESNDSEFTNETDESTGLHVGNITNCTQAEATLMFNSSQEASNFRETARYRGRLGSIPQAYERNKRAVVQCLYDAMVSLDEVCDESLETKNFRRGKYCRNEIEAACWRIADILYELHGSDTCNSSAWESTNEALQHRMRHSESLSFENRLALMCQMLKTRKTACGEALFAEEKLYNIVAAPTAHTKRKATNARSNASKAGRIGGYTKLMKLRKKANNDEELLQLLREFT